MIPEIREIKNMPFASIDLHFAAYLAGESRDPCIFASAAIASAAVRFGHSCCDLNAFAGKSFSDFFSGISSGSVEYKPEKDLPFPGLDEFRNGLFPPVGVVLSPGKEEDITKNIPLVLDSCGRLYLNRYFNYEKELAERIFALVSQPENEFHPQKDQFNGIIRFFHMNGTSPETKKTDWQKFAAYLSGYSPFTVITGGPGTGKTTVVTALLALILERAVIEKQPLPRIVLAAPTGKAKLRLAESIRSSLDDLTCSGETRKILLKIVDPESPENTCGTISSILSPVWNTPYFRRNQESPLNADILLVDEVSMVSLSLMCNLLRALKPGAKLILLGDKDQLASIDAGAVLGDFCKNTVLNSLSAEKREEFIQLADACPDDIVSLPDKKSSLLDGHIAELREVRRFDGNSMIGKISRMIRERQNGEKILSLMMENHAEDFLRKNIPLNPETELRHFFGPLPQILETMEPTLENMKKFFFMLDNKKILCAVKFGKTGVDSLNGISRKIFRMQEKYAHGLPLIILKNDKTTGLANGDIGIVWKTGNDVRVYFPGNPGAGEEPKSFHPVNLPPHEAVFAMTIHKSQGSGFDHVLISMPEYDLPLLSRELLYTAITRAKKRVDLWCSESIADCCLNREVVRHSGLTDRLKKILDENTDVFLLKTENTPNH